MPLTMNVGITKKHGLPDYGSIGASCHVTVELDASVLQGDLDSFHRHVRNAYVACSQAVNDELARQRSSGGQISEPAPHYADSTNHASNNGAQNGSSSHHASAKQLNYLRQLAGQIEGLGDQRLDELANRLFGKSVAELTSFDASSMIDTLKAIKAGRLSLDASLPGACA